MESSWVRSGCGREGCGPLPPLSCNSIRSSSLRPRLPMSVPRASCASDAATTHDAAAMPKRIHRKAGLRAIELKSKTRSPGRQRGGVPPDGPSPKNLGECAMGTLVSYATDKGVATLTLTDPPVNAYTHEMFKELDGNVLEARFDDDVHVLVVTGHGDKYFSAGADVNMLKEADETFKYYFCLHANETLSRLEATPKLVIAALNGHAVGGGFEIALACDLRIARAGTFQLGLPEVNLGVQIGRASCRERV